MSVCWRGEHNPLKQSPAYMPTAGIALARGRTLTHKAILVEMAEPLQPDLRR